MDSKMKRGQVTLFIILAIMIFVALIAVYYLIGRGGGTSLSQQDPNAFIENCAKEIIDSAFNEVFEKGGVLESSQNLMYYGENYTYLCYNGDYYLSCYNLYPMIEEKIEEEVREKTKYAVQNCFNLLKEDLESKGYDVEGESTNYSLDLLPGEISVTLTKKMAIIKGEASQSYKDFSYTSLSPFYEMVNLAREIVNSESQNCNFEYDGYMLLYPDFKIMRIDYDGSKIYQITDRASGKEFKFAVRGCVSPPGI